MTPPPITREAREWLLAYICPSDSDGRLRAIINSMPLAPDLDAVRARFQDKTTGGCTVTMYEVHNGNIYGRADDWGCSWRFETGLCNNKDADEDCHLVLVSPHSALIAELREAEDRCYHGGMDDTARLFKRAADALEKQP